jgi:hypothetical protein
MVVRIGSLTESDLLMFLNRSFLKSFKSGPNISYTSTALNVILIYMADNARRYLSKLTNAVRHCAMHSLEFIRLQVFYKDFLVRLNLEQFQQQA